MASISRRDFVKQASTDLAVASLLAGGGARLAAAPLGLPIGSQTYPHRMMIRDGNFSGLLKTLADLGVGEIELCSALGYTRPSVSSMCREASSSAIESSSAN